MAKSPCEQSFACHRDQACPDTLCPEHPLSLQMLRRPGFLHVQDGGHCVSGEDSLRIPASTEAATEQSDAAGRLLLILAGVLAALLVAASAFDLRFPT